MSSTSNSINQAQVNPSIALSFPQEVKKTITFKCTNQNDLDYLNSEDKEDHFLADVADFSASIELEVIKVE